MFLSDNERSDGKLSSFGLPMSGANCLLNILFGLAPGGKLPLPLLALDPPSAEETKPVAALAAAFFAMFTKLSDRAMSKYPYTLMELFITNVIQRSIHADQSEKI